MNKAYITGSGLWVPPNLTMNQLISKRILGRDATLEEAPVILDKFANTASAGSISRSTSRTPTSRQAASASSARSGLGIRLGVIF